MAVGLNPSMGGANVQPPNGASAPQNASSGPPPSLTINDPSGSGNTVTYALVTPAAPSAPSAAVNSLPSAPPASASSDSGSGNNQSGSSSAGGGIMSMFSGLLGGGGGSGAAAGLLGLV